MALGFESRRSLLRNAMSTLLHKDEAAAAAMALVAGVLG